MHNTYDIFISYRRAGGDKYARTIQQALEKQFRVFLDFDELEDGVFDQRIIDAISQSPVFLLILSKGALDRCVDEKDWVRQEIMHAVKSGCHIVPVTIIGDNFNGLPHELPEELRRAVGSHQFSQLHMETLFKESMAKLVKTRIAPYINKEKIETGAEIHIETDADCRLLLFKKMLAQIYAGEDNVVRLKRGKHKLEFVSVEFEDIKYHQILEIPDEDYTDFVEVKMKETIEAKRKDKKEKLLREADQRKEEECERIEEQKRSALSEDDLYTKFWKDVEELVNDKKDNPKHKYEEEKQKKNELKKQNHNPISGKRKILNVLFISIILIVSSILTFVSDSNGAILFWSIVTIISFILWLKVVF